jgi:hypothetical protein
MPSGLDPMGGNRFSEKDMRLRMNLEHPGSDDRFVKSLPRLIGHKADR